MNELEKAWGPVDRVASEKNILILQSTPGLWSIRATTSSLLLVTSETLLRRGTELKKKTDLVIKSLMQGDPRIILTRYPGVGAAEVRRSEDAHGVVIIVGEWWLEFPREAEKQVQSDFRELAKKMGFGVE